MENNSTASIKRRNDFYLLCGHVLLAAFSRPTPHPQVSPTPETQTPGKNVTEVLADRMGKMAVKFRRSYAERLRILSR